MNPTAFRFACAVAHSGSFSAAANACCVTQPTLSNGIARLEKNLGERIFVRTTRKVTLTPFGNYILPYLNEVVRAQDALKRKAQAFRIPTQRFIRIGMSPLVNAHLLGLMIEPFRDKHPEIEIVLREMNLADLERNLRQDLIDFIFEVGETKKHSLQSIPVYREPLWFVPRRGVPPEKVIGSSVCLADITDETYVMAPPDACGLARATRALFRRHGCKIKEHLGETLSCQVLEEWAALGIGAAILPRSKLTTSTREKALPISDQSGSPIELLITATWPRKVPTAPYLLEFAKYLRSAGQSEVRPSSPQPRSGRARASRTGPGLPKLRST